MTAASSDTHGTHVTLNACAKTYKAKISADGVQALTRTDLDVHPGEILALLGPSGCGKTTMLRIIAGLEQPDTGGRILFDEDDVTALPIEKRAVGMVFQSYALFPNMNVRANVAYGLKIKGLSRQATEDRVAEVLELCQLTELAERPVAALSGGQRQRVAVARAVAPRPRILLLDEPLSALDAALRDQLRDELAQLLRTLSITAVFVTHDQTEAMAIADRVAVMRDGHIEQVDTPEILYRQPVNGFVAGFVGGANRLDGEIEDGVLVTRGGRLALPAGASRTGCVHVRPEAFSLHAPGNAPLTGHVSTRTFLGTHYRLAVDGIAASSLQVTTTDENPPAVGDRVGLDIKRASLLVLEH